MIKVITYGTYDLLHFGHIRLLERAKALGDYLIVGVTADSFDLTRGKINVQQTLMERIEAVRATGIADEIIVEEYEGQKIDDIKRYNVDIFTVGSDWKGYFDYLNDFCKVVYLDRTEGVSSTEIRAERRELRLGLIGNAKFLNKLVRESHYVNGIKITGICTDDRTGLSEEILKLDCITNSLEVLLQHVDAIYIISVPLYHYSQIKDALINGKHVLCEAPLVLSTEHWQELQQLAKDNNCILMDAIRTAFSIAFSRILLLVKSGRIGDVVSVDATCTSLRMLEDADKLSNSWNSIEMWGPTALMPIYSLLGTEYKQKLITSHIVKDFHDSFTKVSFVFQKSVASLKVGTGVKSEGELVISGTKGYVYVPAPWWKTDYFEIRFENPSDNKRYFYQLDGEGIRLELLSFLRAINTGKSINGVGDDISIAIVKMMEDYYQLKDVVLI